MDKDSWNPSASIDTLLKRASFFRDIRGFFDGRGYYEVETPILGRHGVTDPYLENIQASFQQQQVFLQTSPEYHMKRLLAAGSGAIYQLARSFRDDEIGRWHNPEFTLLEWYRPDWTHIDLMQEVDVFLQNMLQTRAAKKISYQDLFIEICGFDPISCDIWDFGKILIEHQLSNVLPVGETDRDQYLFLIMSHIIEPVMAKYEVPVIVYDFPTSQAALSRINEGRAERFEVYYRGVELANGFHELISAREQRERFNQDNKKRIAHGKSAMALDENFLAALESGLPNCSGVALGVDRLFALFCGEDTISKVMAFDYSIS